MKKEKIAEELIRIAEELVGGGRRLRREDVTERDFPILEVFDWEFIEEGGEYGRVKIIEGKSDNELKEVFERKLGKPISYAEAYISKNLYTDISYMYDSRAIMENMAEEDAELTKQLQDDFENYDGGSWANWIKNWLKERGCTIVRGGNTYNWDEWNGSVFEFIVFDDVNGEPKMVVMWHLGGDVRGNYSYPEVWNVDFEEFISEHWDVPVYEVLGYDSEEDMQRDLEILTTGSDEYGKLVNIEHQRAEEHGQQRLFD
jgi:hypothetical protein